MRRSVAGGEGSIWIRVALLLAVVLPWALAGCGGGGGGASSSTSSASGGDQTAGGAEKSIEGFGAEAEGSTREEILGVERSYFEALAAKRFAVACSRLASKVQRSLDELTGGKREVGCARIVPELLAPQAYAIARQQARASVRKVRVEGDRAFVVFHAPGARLYQLPLVRERGEWKVGLLTASVLAPSLSTLRQ